MRICGREQDDLGTIGSQFEEGTRNAITQMGFALYIF